MVNKKNISASDIVKRYMEHVLEHDVRPKSVYTFAKNNNIKELDFYVHFGSFQAIEKHIFAIFFNNAMKLLEKSNDYQSFDARNKLLSFYYTFFETLTANRSYVVYALSKDKNKLKCLELLSNLKYEFSKYVANLDIETIDIKQEIIDKIQQKAIQESAWIQLLITIKFWLEDTSSNSEKTDIFIEKSVNTSFDILNITPLKSVIDFGKFLFKEKVQMI